MPDTSVRLSVSTFVNEVRLINNSGLRTSSCEPLIEHR